MNPETLGVHAGFARLAALLARVIGNLAARHATPLTMAAE
jgi:hypothetical protein